MRTYFRLINKSLLSEVLTSPGNVLNLKSFPPIIVVRRRGLLVLIYRPDFYTCSYVYVGVYEHTRTTKGETG